MALSARPTMYDGIQMRSRLEATFAAFLDRHAIPWEYEPRAFAGAAGGQYLPDFLLWPHGRRVYVELKGKAARADIPTFERQAALIRRSEPDAEFAVVDAFHMRPEAHLGFAIGYRPAGLDMWWTAYFAICSSCGAVDLALVRFGWIVDCRSCDKVTPPVAFLNPTYRPEAA